MAFDKGYVMLGRIAQIDSRNSMVLLGSLGLDLFNKHGIYYSSEAMIKCLY